MFIRKVLGISNGYTALDKGVNLSYFVLMFLLSDFHLTNPFNSLPGNISTFVNVNSRPSNERMLSSTQINILIFRDILNHAIHFHITLSLKNLSLSQEALVSKEGGKI